MATARNLKKPIAAVVLTTAAVALWHGLYIPVSWLSPWTQSLLADRAVSFSAGRAVVSMLPMPRLRLIDAQLTSSLSQQPLARAGLLTLEFAVKPGASPWVELHGITAKGAEIWIDQTAAEGSNWSAWPRVPPRSDRKLKLPQQIRLENSFIYLQNSHFGSTTAHIDQLRLLRDGSAPSSLAVRLQSPNLSGNLQVTANVQSDEDSWTVDEIQSDFSGRFDGYPWSATMAIASLKRGDGDQATPLEMAHTRLYVRRDDDPDEHQAVFSAASARFHPADGRNRFRFAEWTYTHEKAEAWTFHAEWDAALGRLTVEPATIEGSEAVPARPLNLNLRCINRPMDGAGPVLPTRTNGQPAPMPIPAIRPVWVWHDGWFFWAEELTGRSLQATAQVKPTMPIGTGAKGGTVPGKPERTTPRILACQP